MSRLFLRVLFPALLIAAFCAIQAAGQTPAAPAPAAIAPAKIAWVDLQQAVTTCEEGANLYSEIQKFMETKRSEMDAMKKEASRAPN
jgi:hypothetical protein